MQTAPFGQRLNLPSFGSSFVKLKKKGDKIRFVIADTPKFETLHWINNQKILCGRYNGADKTAFCKYCNQWEDFKAQGDKDSAKEVAPQTTFYYPVLNLTDENDPRPAILETKPKVHWKINGYQEKEGIDPFECLWSVERAEEPDEYWAVRNLGKISLTTDQQAILEKARGIKLSASRESSSVRLQTEEETRPDEE